MNYFVDKTCTLQDIINKNIVVKNKIEARCEKCSKVTNCFHKTEITSINNIIIMQLMLFENNNGQLKKSNSKYNIKNVSSSTFSIQGHQFKVSSAIFHHGLLKKEGHYTSRIKNKKNWILANDSNIILKEKWARNSKKVYVLFAEKQ